MPRSSKRNFFLSRPISKITPLPVRETACQLMKTQIVVCLSHRWPPTVCLDPKAQMRCNIADTAGVSGQYPAHTMVFIMTLLWTTINITSTQTNEEVPRRDAWFQCVFKGLRWYKCVWFRLWFVLYLSECLWSPGIIIQSTMKPNHEKIQCKQAASEKWTRTRPLVLIVAHHVQRIMTLNFFLCVRVCTQATSEIFNNAP